MIEINSDIPKIIICRHAESIEDVDNSIYDKLHDLEIPLTLDGYSQARLFSQKLKSLLSTNRKVVMYTSPGIRNVQTLDIVLLNLPKALSIEVHIESLIVKQDWGNITPENRSDIEADRYATGVLRYTFPTGESTASLIARLTRFKEMIFKRQMVDNVDIVIFSHGFEFRVLLMIIFNWTEDEFESYSNLGNCEHRILFRIKANEYLLSEPLKKHGLPISRRH